jgi:pimeloyl-ACP methyl ester carboxylesterase
VLAADVHGVLEALAVSDCYLVGHSMGGMVAQEFVLRYPEMVSALVLVDTAADPPESLPMDERARLVDLASREGMEAVFEEMLDGSPLTPVLAKENPQFIDRWREQFLMTSVEAYMFCAQAIAARRSLLEDLSRVRVPTLIVCGALDEPFLEPSRRMHQQMEGSELVIIEGCGHTPALEKPSELAETLLSFFARADARRSEAASPRS